MNSVIAKALEQLNAVYAETGRQYSIIEDCQYILVMPGGGEYPPASSYETLVRLVTLRNAAIGRGTR